MWSLLLNICDVKATGKTYGRVFDTISQTAAMHYDVIMGAMASQITSLTIVYSTVYSGADQRKHQSSTSLAFVRGIHRGPVNSPHKWPVTRKMFPFDDVIMLFLSKKNAAIPTSELGALQVTIYKLDSNIEYLFRNFPSTSCFARCRQIHCDYKLRRIDWKDTLTNVTKLE